MSRFSLGGALLALCACSGVAFTSELKGEAVVPAGPGPTLGALPLLSSLSDVDFDLNPDFKQQMVTRAQTTYARVDGATAKVLTTGRDFSFLDQLQLVARSGSAETVFAEVNTIASGKTELQLDVLKDANDITTQVKSAAASFVMRGKGRPPPADTRLEVTLTLRIEAQPSGH